MWPRAVLCVLVMVMLTGFSMAAVEIDCCQCESMYPQNLPAGVRPQVMPSPFIIQIEPLERNEYRVGGDGIHVNLTTHPDDRGRKFTHFMIKAVRIDKTRNTDEAIGVFEVRDKSIAIASCYGAYGSAMVSTKSDPKSTVHLSWLPRTFQGHIEFRATFVENNNTFWVREKSRPLFDKNVPLPPALPAKYIPPPIQTINVDQCGTSKGCYRIPEGCIEVECAYIFTWMDLGGRMVFEMSAMTDGFNDRYFAIGLSDDIYMGKDLVFECVHNSSSGRVEVFQSFNIEDEHRNVRLQNSQIGITYQEGSYNEGRIRCRFHREPIVNNEELSEYGLKSKPWHLLMARGPSSLGQIKHHGLSYGHLPVASPDEVSLDVAEDISGRARYHLVKAHACLMLLAWIFFAPIGLIWMKYYTTMWPNSRFMGERYWLVSHFSCTFWVVILVVIGVILVFIEADGWASFPDLPEKAHPILGIIVFISVLIIPIIALIRCPESHTCRPIGNWFYWLFWTIAFCLAIPNIFIGMDFGKAMVPWWLTWILCIFFLFNLICEVILEVHQCCTHKKNKERRKKWELQKKENPNMHIPEPWPAGRTFKRNVLYTHFIVCLIVVIIAVITVAVS